MKRISLTMDGFLAYEQATTITYADGQITAITGPNGSGKTSIPDAIAWVRYGVVRMKGDADSVINDSLDEATVTEVCEDQNGNVWKFVRQKRREKAQRLSVFSWDEESEEWIRQGSKLIRDNQRIIDELVGLSQEAFYSLCVFESRGGNRGIRLVGSKSDDRIDILTSLMPGMEVWPDFNKKIAARLRDTKRELGNVTAERQNVVRRTERESRTLSDLEDQVARQGDGEAILAQIEDEESTLRALMDNDHARKVESLRNSLALAREKRENRLHVLTAKKNDVAREIGEVRASRDHHSQLLAEMKEIEGEMKDALEERKEAKKRASRAKKGYETANERLNKSREEFASLNAQVESLSSREEEKREQLDRLVESGDEGVCMVCNSELTPKKTRSLVSSLEGQIARLEGEIEEVEDKIDKSQKARMDAQGRSRKYDREMSLANKDVEELVDTLANLKAEREQTKGLIEEASEVASQADELLEELEAREADLAEDIREVEEEGEKKDKELRSKIDRAKKSLPKAKEVKAAENRVARLRKAHDTAVRNEGKIEEISRLLEDLRDEEGSLRKEERSLSQAVSDLEILKVATSQKGIPTIMLSKMLTLIETRADELLTIINGSEGMTVELLQDDNDGESNPTLEIMVTFPDGSVRPVEALSNGEVTRVSLALMFSIASVVNGMRPGTVQDAFLDEPLASIDEAGIEGVMSALGHVIRSGIMSSILIVAHHQKVVNACDNQIAVGDLQPDEENWDD